MKTFVKLMSQSSSYYVGLGDTSKTARNQDTVEAASMYLISVLNVSVHKL